MPDIRLKFGETYTFRIQGVTDQGGNAPIDPYQSSFSTFTPRVIGRIEDIDARDVVWIEPTSLGLSPCVDLIAVAEGGTLPERPDHLGGIVIYDVTDPLNPERLAEVVTPGTDNALEFIVPSQPLVTADAGTFNGPFIISVDGIGAGQTKDRFGAWRIFELRNTAEEGVEIVQIASRLVNQSAETHAAGDSQSTILGSAIEFVPNKVGVPLGVAGFGSQVAYVANNPFLGLQAISLDQLVTAPLVTPQVDATLLGVYRDVDTLGNKVIAVAQEGSESRMQIIDPGLAGVIASEPLRRGRAVRVLGVRNWSARTGFESSEVLDTDLAIAAASEFGLAVFPVDSSNASFSTGFPGAPGMIPIGPGVADVVADRGRQLLFVANRAAGAAIADLSVVVGTRDTDHDGRDDRVIGDLVFDGAQAVSIATFEDRVGAPLIAVGLGDGGLAIGQVGRANLTEFAAVTSQLSLSQCVDVRVTQTVTWSPVAQNSPQVFAGHSQLADPCNRLVQGPALVIPFDSVSPDRIGVTPFDVNLLVQVNPNTLTPSDLDEVWGMEPGSTGSLDPQHGFDVVLSDIQHGGVYTSGVGQNRPVVIA